MNVGEPQQTRRCQNTNNSESCEGDACGILATITPGVAMRVARSQLQPANTPGVWNIIRYFIILQAAARSHVRVLPRAALRACLPHSSSLLTSYTLPMGATMPPVMHERRCRPARTKMVKATFVLKCIPFPAPLLIAAEDRSLSTSGNLGCPCAAMNKTSQTKSIFQPPACMARKLLVKS